MTDLEKQLAEALRLGVEYAQESLLQCKRNLAGHPDRCAHVEQDLREMLQALEAHDASLRDKAQQRAALAELTQIDENLALYDLEAQRAEPAALGDPGARGGT